MQTTTKSFILALMTSVVMSKQKQPSKNPNAFPGWQARYNKQYKTVEEMQKRGKIFEANLKHIDEINQRITDPDLHIEVNDTGDLTMEEWGRSRGLYRAATDSLQIDEEETELFYKENEDKEQEQGRHLYGMYPIDWVAEGNVGPVKDNGLCNAGHAFAATTVQEAMQSIKNDYPPVRLSEEEALRCQSYSPDVMSVCTERQGYAHQIWRDQSAVHGSAEYSQAPWVSHLLYDHDPDQIDITFLSQILDYFARYQCQSKQNNEIASRADPSTIRSLNSNNEKFTALTNGPFAARIYAFNDCFRYANNFNHHWSALRQDEVCGHSYIYHGPQSADHTVTVVGIKQEQDGDWYWIVQNSWGTDWGNNGYFYVKLEGSLIGAFGFNLYPDEAMDVMPGYGESDKCKIEEQYIFWGWLSYCTNKYDCKGARTCMDNICVGESGCF